MIAVEEGFVVLYIEREQSCKRDKIYSKYCNEVKR